MLGLMKGLLKAKYAAAGLVALGVYEAYAFLAPVAPELEPEKMRAAEEAAAAVARAMPEEWRRKKMFVAPVASDASGYVTQSLKRAVARLDKAEPVAPPLTEKVISLITALAGKEAGAATPEARAAALKVAKEAGAELLLLGRVRELSLTDGVPRIDLGVEVLDAGTGSKAWELDAAWTPPFLERTVGLVSPMKRAVGWILFVMLLPWAVMPVMKRVLERESNAANAVLLVSLAGLAAVLAYVALAGDLAGWAGGFFLLAIAFGFLYNAGILNYVAGFER